MYPVISTLRRVAAHVVYVSRDHLYDVEGTVCVRLATRSGHLDLTSGRWLTATDEVPMQELVVSAASSAAAAISLTMKENSISEAAKAADAVFTMVMAPEVELIEDGAVVRKIRFAVIRGVYRASASRLVPIKGKNLVKASYFKSRKNAVRL